MAKDDFPFTHDEFRLQARRLPRRTVRSDAPSGRQRHPNGCRLPAHGPGDLCCFIRFGELTNQSSSWRKSDREGGKPGHPKLLLLHGFPPPRISTGTSSLRSPTASTSSRPTIPASVIRTSLHRGRSPTLSTKQPRLLRDSSRRSASPTSACTSRTTAVQLGFALSTATLTG